MNKHLIDYNNTYSNNNNNTNNYTQNSNKTKKNKIYLGKEQPKYKIKELNEICAGGTIADVGSPTMTRRSPLTYRSNKNALDDCEAFGDYSYDVYAPNPDKITTNKSLNFTRGSKSLTTLHSKLDINFDDEVHKAIIEKNKRRDPVESLTRAGSVSNWGFISKPSYPIYYNNNNAVVKPWELNDNPDKDLCTTKKWNKTQKSTEYPLRTVMLDPSNNNIERHTSYTTLRKDIDENRLQDYHKSYDLDEDGVVGREDLKASQTFDKNGIGIIDNEDKEKAREILVDV